MRAEESGPDLRLAALAVGAWLSALLALYASALSGAILAAAAGLLAAALLSSRRRLLASALGRQLRRVRETTRRRAWLPEPAARLAVRWRASLSGRGAHRVAVAVLLGIVCGAGATAGRVAARDAPAIVDLADQRASVVAEVVVRDDPRLAGDANRPMHVVSTDLRWLRPVGGDDAERIRASVRILVLGTNKAWGAPLPGQRVLVEGRLDRPRGGDLTAAVISSGAAPEMIGRPSWAQRAAGSLRAGLQRACLTLPPEPGGLLPGLVLGDTSRLDPAVEEDFRATGLTHLTAVSGANVAIVIGLVLIIARWCRAGPWTSAILCGLALVAFVILVRPRRASSVPRPWAPSG